MYYNKRNMMFDAKPLVSICCLAYNHEPYIRECLDGMLMQRTTFKFEILIHDDASTDNTAKIIKEYAEKYPTIIKPILQTENQYSKGKGILAPFVYPKAKGKYIALCEGDDYWIDPYKLQKQVDFLENNKEFSYCVHRYLSFDVEKEKYDDSVYPISSSNYLCSEKKYVVITKKIFHEKWLVKTLSVVFRKEAYELIKNDLKNYKYSRDIHLFYFLLNYGDAVCLDMVSGVYNKHLNGVFSKKSHIEKNTKAYLIYKELYIKSSDPYFLYPLLANALFLLFRGRFSEMKDLFSFLRINDYCKLISVFIHKVLNN